MTLSHPDTKRGQQNRRRECLILFYHRAGCGSLPQKLLPAKEIAGRIKFIWTIHLFTIRNVRLAELLKLVSGITLRHGNQRIAGLEDCISVGN